VPLGRVELEQMLCVEDERVVGRDVVTAAGVALQVAKQPGRRTFAGLRRVCVTYWANLLERARQDRAKRTLEGQSEFVPREEILLPDRQSAELTAAARRGNPAAVSIIPLEYVDDTREFNPEWVVDKIAPRPVLFITIDNDRLVPPEESLQLYARASEPKKLVMLKGFGHYEVYAKPAFDEVMQATLAWYRQYLPARES
jgi:pimeloyl-ACP methyl ester carboxylesterase